MSLLNFLTFGLLGKKHDHTCHCGGLNHAHQTGERGCLRVMTVPPEKQGDSYWRVGGHSITDYTLKEQRGYYQHPCGCWSRH